MRKKIIALLVLLHLIVFISPAGLCFAYEPETSCRSAALMDARTGEILYEKNADEKLPIASLTKIMTMLIAFEKLDGGAISLNDNVTVSSKAASMGGSQLFLEEGEIRTVEELLYGIAVESGNDAAVALAEYIGGSYDSFISMMNDKADKLSLTNTHFSTPCGLIDENNYSTARDIALLSYELLKHNIAYDYISTWNIELTIGKDNDIPRTLTNTNKLLSTTDYVDGIKTGYTAAAGHCISATAEKNGLRLISVVLNGTDSISRFKDATSLLEFGFSNFSAKYIVKKGDCLTEINIENASEEKIPVIVQEDLYLLCKLNENKEVNCEIELQNDLIAPIDHETQVGKAVYTVGEEKFEIPLYPEKDIEKISFAEYLNKTKMLFLP